MGSAAATVLGICGGLFIILLIVLCVYCCRIVKRSKMQGKVDKPFSEVVMTERNLVDAKPKEKAKPRKSTKPARAVVADEEQKEVAKVGDGPSGPSGVRQSKHRPSRMNNKFAEPGNNLRLNTNTDTENSA